MTVMMSKKIFLEVCIGIEGLCADLYHYYSEIYVDIPEASQFWKKTALEEENHKRQFEMALRLMNESEFEVTKDGLKRAYAVQYKLLKLIDHVKVNQPELLTAVSKAVDMEGQLAELHAHTSLLFKEKSMHTLFRSLSEADQGHVSDMQRYLNILNLPLCEMEG